MTNYSQKDPQWANEFINKTKFKMATDGCLVSCVSILNDTDPLTTLRKLEKEKCFVGAEMILEKVAQVLSLEFIKTEDSRLISPAPMKLPCLAEVDFSPAEGKQKHFVVYLGNNRIIDPFDGKEKDSKYKIVNYRNIFPRKEKQAEQKIEELKQENEELKKAKEEKMDITIDLLNVRAKELARQGLRINDLEALLKENLVSNRLKSLAWYLGHVVFASVATYFISGGDMTNSKMVLAVVLASVNAEVTKYLNKRYQSGELENKL